MTRINWVKPNPYLRPQGRKYRHYLLSIKNYFSPIFCRHILCLPFFFLTLLAGAGFQCKPTRISSSLTGKLVAVGPCSQYVVQVIEGSYTPGQVDTIWKNTANDSVFHNVFAVGNACTFALNGLEQGAIFSFEWDPKAPAELCATCMVFYPTPSKYNTLQHVRRIK